MVTQQVRHASLVDSKLFNTLPPGNELERISRRRATRKSCFFETPWERFTPLKTNMSPKKWPCQNKSCFPTTIQGTCQCQFWGSLLRSQKIYISMHSSSNSRAVWVWFFWALLHPADCRKLCSSVTRCLAPKFSTTSSATVLLSMLWRRVMSGRRSAWHWTKTIQWKT